MRTVVRIYIRSDETHRKPDECIEQFFFFFFRRFAYLRMYAGMPTIPFIDDRRKTLDIDV
jgi:hypothetical protein